MVTHTARSRVANGCWFSAGRPGRWPRRRPSLPVTAAGIRRLLSRFLASRCRPSPATEPGSPDQPRDKHREETGTGTDSETLTEHLVDAGVLTDAGTGEGVRLGEQFRRDWWRRIHLFRDDGDRVLEHLAALLDTHPEELSFEEGPDRVLVRQDGVEIGTWPAHAALLADIALYPTIDEWFPGWTRMDGDARAALLGRLRAFLRECPDCGGTIRPEATHDPEIDGRTVSMTCDDCGAVLVSGWY
ncbi:MAG: hypothetical protein V5A55_01555 [Halovenus sp.]